MEGRRRPLTAVGLSTGTLALILVTVILSLVGMLLTTAAAFGARNDARADAAAARLAAADAAAEIRANDLEQTCRAGLAMGVDLGLIDHAIAQSQLLIDTLSGGANATSTAELRATLDELLAIRRQREATADVCNRPPS